MKQIYTELPQKLLGVTKGIRKTLNTHFWMVKCSFLESEIILQLNPTFPLKKEDENKITI